MKRIFFGVLLLVGVGAAVAAYLNRPVPLPDQEGTWEPAEHEPATN